MGGRFFAAFKNDVGLAGVWVWAMWMGFEAGPYPTPAGAHKRRTLHDVVVG